MGAYFLLSYKVDFMLFFFSAYILPHSLWLHLCFKQFVQMYTVCSAMVFHYIYVYIVKTCSCTTVLRVSLLFSFLKCLAVFNLDCLKPHATIRFLSVEVNSITLVNMFHSFLPCGLWSLSELT